MKQFYKISGFVCMGLGFAGAFLPVLPTTPFLLLALYLFARSEPRLRCLILKNKVLGPYIKGYAEGKGTPLKIKIGVIATLWASIGISILLVENGKIRLVLLAVAIGVTLHILLQKSQRDLS